jgi:fermentation-respiration switch protein FrsA (DUF1100 family)
MPHSNSLACLLLLTSCAIPKPGPFYATPANPTDAHGTLLVAAPFATSLSGAAGYRIIYNSESESGRIIPVSGMVFIPTTPPPPGGRPTIAWAHATTGIAAGCAPSLDPQNPGIPGLENFISAGDVVTATDYEGLGEPAGAAPGTHPYLIGNAEGQNIIDSVLAAQNLPGANLSGAYVLWGHSQGGHAALFAGQIAASYAPNLHLAGIAAAAPVTDVFGELTEPFHNNTGLLLHSYFYTAYAQTYGIPLSTIIAPNALPAVAKTASKCLTTLPDALNALLTAHAIPKNFLASPPQSTPPWPTLLTQNSPGQSPPGAPLLLMQGAADPTVEPHWTETFAAKLCAEHRTLAFHLLPGVNHLAAATAALPTVLPWIAARLASKPPPNTCPAA